MTLQDAGGNVDSEEVSCFRSYVKLDLGLSVVGRECVPAGIKCEGNIAPALNACNIASIDKYGWADRFAT